MPHVSDSYIIYDGTTEVRQIVVANDPGAGAGTPAPLGSVAQMSDGAVGRFFLKDGPLDTNWSELVFGDHQAPTYIVGNQVAGDGPGDCNYLETGLGNAIGLAVAALPPEGGWVHVKRGIYNLDVPVQLADNVKLTGDGPNTVIAAPLSPHVFELIATAGNVFRDITIRDLALIHGSAGIVSSMVGRALIQNVVFDGLMSGSLLNIQITIGPPMGGSSRVVIDSCVGVDAGEFVQMQGFVWDDALDLLIFMNNALNEVTSLYRDNGGYGAKKVIVANNHLRTSMGASALLRGTMNSELVVTGNYVAADAPIQINDGGNDYGRMYFYGNSWEPFNSPFGLSGRIRGFTAENETFVEPGGPAGRRGYYITGDAPGNERNDITIRSTNAWFVRFDRVYYASVTDHGEMAQIDIERCSQIRIANNDFIDSGGDGCVYFRNGAGIPSVGVSVVGNRFGNIGSPAVNLSDPNVRDVLIEANSFGTPDAGGVLNGAVALYNNVIGGLTEPIGVLFRGNNVHYYECGVQWSSVGMGLSIVGNGFFAIQPGGMFNAVLDFPNGVHGVHIADNVFEDDWGTIVHIQGNAHDFRFNQNRVENVLPPSVQNVLHIQSGVGSNEHLQVIGNIVRAAERFMYVENSRVEYGLIADNMLSEFDYNNTPVIDSDFHHSTIRGNHIRGAAADLSIRLINGGAASENNIIMGNHLEAGNSEAILVDPGYNQTRILFNYMPLGITDNSGGFTVQTGNWG